MPPEILMTSVTTAAGSSTAAAAIGTQAVSGGGVRLSKTLFAWHAAVSPHLAMEAEGRHVSDAQLLGAVAAELRSFSAAGASTSGSGSSGIAIIETAGGVASQARIQ